MIKLILFLSLLVGSFAFLMDDVYAGEKCEVQKSGLFRCVYTMRKKKSKLREWARAFCQNKGYAKEIKKAEYGLCNKKGKKCRRISGYCVKRK